MSVSDDGDDDWDAACMAALQAVEAVESQQGSLGKLAPSTGSATVGTGACAGSGGDEDDDDMACMQALLEVELQLQQQQEISLRSTAPIGRGAFAVADSPAALSLTAAATGSSHVASNSLPTFVHGTQATPPTREEQEQQLKAGVAAAAAAGALPPPPGYSGGGAKVEPCWRCGGTVQQYKRRDGTVRYRYGDCCKHQAAVLALAAARQRPQHKQAQLCGLHSLPCVISQSALLTGASTLYAVPAVAKNTRVFPS
jgi:hypothetical protein